MKLLLTVIMVSFSFLLFGQKLKKVKESGRNGKFIYYVLKDDPKIKHGKYIQKPWGGPELLVEGEYDMGKRTGLWTERYYGKSIRGLKSEGHYENDEKIGKWYYFDIRKDTAQVYDYTANKLIYSKSCKGDTEYQVETQDGTFEKIKLDCPADYIGGMGKLIVELQESLSYPQELNTSGVDRFKIDTKVILTISDEGGLVNVEFTNPIGYGYEGKIESWLRDSEKEWLSGSLNDESVTSKVMFGLNLSYQF